MVAKLLPKFGVFFNAELFPLAGLPRLFGKGFVAGGGDHAHLIDPAMALIKLQGLL